MPLRTPGPTTSGRRPQVAASARAQTSVSCGTHARERGVEGGACAHGPQGLGQLGSGPSAVSETGVASSHVATGALVASRGAPASFSPPAPPAPLSRHAPAGPSWRSPGASRRSRPPRREARRLRPRARARMLDRPWDLPIVVPRGAAGTYTVAVRAVTRLPTRGKRIYEGASHESSVRPRREARAAEPRRDRGRARGLRHHHGVLGLHGPQDGIAAVAHHLHPSITALVLLRALGHTSLNEANVTQVIMSAGSMVAGGLAFTLPGAWMLGLGEQMGWAQILFVALAGTLLGLVFTALIRRRFVDESAPRVPHRPRPPRSTLLASRDGGRHGQAPLRLHGRRPAPGARPETAWASCRRMWSRPYPSPAWPSACTPRRCSLRGLPRGRWGAAVLWVLGAVLANFGIVVGGTGAGLGTSRRPRASSRALGMGLMMGSGLGVVAKDVLPEGRSARCADAGPRVSPLPAAPARGTTPRRARPARARGATATRSPSWSRPRRSSCAWAWACRPPRAWSWCFSPSWPPS